MSACAKDVTESVKRSMERLRTEKITFDWFIDFLLLENMELQRLAQIWVEKVAKLMVNGQW
jgi:hypothetical protein